MASYDPAVTIFSFSTESVPEPGTGEGKTTLSSGSSSGVVGYGVFKYHPITTIEYEDGFEWKV